MSDGKDDELLHLKMEMETLREQINSMEEQFDFKQKAIADLAREKEKLSLDLRKQKRANANLRQQLEDERSFYLKEKEQYCQEMNDSKKWRRKENEKKLKPAEVVDSKANEENAKLRETLKQTLQANYNLSVKFLRMKNTKFCIKNRLKKLQVEHEKVITELKAQVERAQSEIELLISRQMQFNSSPSDKKYLQIMKTNSQLLHENLNLQAQVDQLSYGLDAFKTAQVKQETSGKLKYIRTSKHSPPSEDGGKEKQEKRRITDKESQTEIRLTDEIVISEYVSATLTNASTRKSSASTRKSSLSTIICDVEAENDLLLLPAESAAESCEIVRTQSAPGVIENVPFREEDVSRFVCTADIFTNT